LIKYILVAIVLFILIGGAVSFQSDDVSWQIIISKDDIFSSMRDGAIKIYNFIKDIIYRPDLVGSGGDVIIVTE